MTEFSSPEVEEAYWNAVERVAEARGAPEGVRAKRQEALLKWLPTPAERKLAAEIRVRVDKRQGYRTPQWILDLAKGDNGKLESEPCLQEKEFTMSTPIFDSVANVTTDESGQPTPKPTAKVAAGAIAGIALTVVVAVLGAIDVNLLGFLGGWAPVALVGIGALASSLAAYLKKPTGEIN